MAPSRKMLYLSTAICQRRAPNLGSVTLAKLVLSLYVYLLYLLCLPILFTYHKRCCCSVCVSEGSNAINFDLNI